MLESVHFNAPRRQLIGEAVIYILSVSGDLRRCLGDGQCRDFRYMSGLEKTVRQAEKARGPKHNRAICRRARAKSGAPVCLQASSSSCVAEQAARSVALSQRRTAVRNKSATLKKIGDAGRVPPRRGTRPHPSHVAPSRHAEARTSTHGQWPPAPRHPQWHAQSPHRPARAHRQSA